MKKYNAYKPSGVEWIGDVPQGWIIGKMKFYTNIIMGQSPDGKDITDDGETPFMQGNAEFTEKYPNPIYYCESCNKHSRIGDVLMSVRAPVGELNLSDKIYGIGRGLCSIKALQNKLLTPFLWYYLMKSKNDFNSFANGSTFTAITIDDLKNFPLILPPLSEQTAIAAFLDAKCAKIDNVMSVQQKRIDLLKELKQSIITNAVTKGLDKNVEFKPSGIEWIGDIPEKWTVKKVSWLFQLGSGTTPKSGDKRYYVDDGGYNWLQTGDLNDSFILETSKKISKAAIEECNLKIYPKGSMVVAMYGATIGKTGILNIDTAVNQACCVLKKSKDVNEMFAFYMFQAGKPSLLRDANGGGQPNISQEIIAGKKFAIPPYKEQLKIVDYLNKKNYAIDNQISKIERQIELLKEYKQSIITECVTGKRKVC